MAPSYEFMAPPGSKDYLPALLTHIRSVLPHPINIQVQPTILHSLLLCLIVGNKNLILRTSEDETSQVMKLTTVGLTSVFGLTTHKLRLHSNMTPDAFMEALLTRPPRLSNSRPSMSGSMNGGGLPYSLSRSSSSPGDMSQSTGSSPSSARKLPARASLNPVESQSQIPFRRAQALPEALVISGLEHAGLPAQRALFKLLVDRKIQLNGVLTDIPAGLLKVVVYVGNWKPSERPNIHTGLLDRFCMSNDVSIPPALENGKPSPSPSRNNRDAATNAVISPLILSQFRTLVQDIHFLPPLTLYFSDLFTATRHHPELDSMLLTSQAHHDAFSLAKAHCVLQGETNILDQLAKESIDMSSLSNGDGTHVKVTVQSLDGITEEIADRDVKLSATQRDVAVTFSRAVTHRLRVRDGPESEILSSLLYPAVRDHSLEVAGDTSKRSVKEILVEILASV